MEASLPPSPHTTARSRFSKLLSVTFRPDCPHISRQISHRIFLSACSDIRSSCSAQPIFPFACSSFCSSCSTHPILSIHLLKHPFFLLSHPIYSSVQASVLPAQPIRSFPSPCSCCALRETTITPTRTIRIPITLRADSCSPKISTAHTWLQSRYTLRFA